MRERGKQAGRIDRGTRSTYYLLEPPLPRSCLLLLLLMMMIPVVLFGLRWCGESGGGGGGGGGGFSCCYAGHVVDSHSLAGVSLVERDSHKGG